MIMAEGTKDEYISRVDGQILVRLTFLNGRLQKYYYNDLLHRNDGPARVWSISSGKGDWWYHGEYFASKEEWFEALTPTEKQSVIWFFDEI